MAIAYAVAGLVGQVVSIALFNFYDLVNWPILLLPGLILFFSRFGACHVVRRHGKVARGRGGIDLAPPYSLHAPR